MPRRASTRRVSRFSTKQRFSNAHTYLKSTTTAAGDKLEGGDGIVLFSQNTPQEAQFATRKRLSNMKIDMALSTVAGAPEVAGIAIYRVPNGAQAPSVNMYDVAPGDPIITVPSWLVWAGLVPANQEIAEFRLPKPLMMNAGDSLEMVVQFLLADASAISFSYTFTYTLE